MTIKRASIIGLACIWVAVAPAWAGNGDTTVTLPREAPAKLYRPGNSALFQQGVKAFDDKDYATAFQIFSQLADKDDIAAMRNVALMERKGLGTPKDPKAAIEMYRKSAEGGLATSAADLGEMLLEGEGGKPDPDAALPWLEAAAAANHPVAQYLLAGMYARGYGVDRDVKKAETLYAAAAPRIPAAQEKLDALKAQEQQDKKADDDSGWSLF